MKNGDNIKVSLVILTFNRPNLLFKELEKLAFIKYRPFEVLVVDNHSDQPVNEIVNDFAFTRLIRMDQNLGISGRNRGVELASGEIIITLDDDVFGITDADIEHLLCIFKKPEIGAVCFKVLDEETGKIINWCHHRMQEKYSDLSFITDEITEGAVAFRKETLDQTGLYPEEFFISHEGPDLALRIMNCGYNVIYTPEIVVQHSHAVSGRTSWRRYYYDTRNLIWLILRNYPIALGIRRLTTGLAAMLIYSLRDGYILYWFKGIIDGIKGGRYALSKRTPMTTNTLKLINQLRSYRPSIIYMLKKRFFEHKVEI